MVRDAILVLVGERSDFTRHETSGGRTVGIEGVVNAVHVVIVFDQRVVGEPVAVTIMGFRRVRDEVTVRVVVARIDETIEVGVWRSTAAIDRAVTVTVDAHVGPSVAVVVVVAGLVRVGDSVAIRVEVFLAKQPVTVCVPTFEAVQDPVAVDIAIGGVHDPVAITILRAGDLAEKSEPSSEEREAPTKR